MEYTQAHISKADWDSNNFNLNIGNFFIDNPEGLSPVALSDTIKQVVSIGKRDKYQLLYLKLPFKIELSKLTLDCKKIILADTKVIYKKQIANKCSDAQNEHISNYTASEANETLLGLSFESGKHSRFKLDPNFPPGTFEKLYSKWINKILSKEADENIIVYQINGEILGMLTYSIQSTIVVVGLIAVDKSHQGKNIGSALLSSLEDIVFSKGISIIELATQKHNLVACNFYQKNKFFIKQEINIYHIWL